MKNALNTGIQILQYAADGMKLNGQKRLKYAINWSIRLVMNFKLLRSFPFFFQPDAK
uniref:Uncharacterized protein n=1 Tax=Tetranychus urticae TaxID=32264 RepID=A0A158P4R6_TETUR